MSSGVYLASLTVVMEFPRHDGRREREEKRREGGVNDGKVTDSLLSIWPKRAYST
jgi:hypothetical protein